jgi:hypothetical protein
VARISSPGKDQQAFTDPSPTNVSMPSGTGLKRSHGDDFDIAGHDTKLIKVKYDHDLERPTSAPIDSIPIDSALTAVS